jgi:hypothetical protein
LINLISTQADNDRVTGPSKVFRNLVRGLDAIGYPYVVNRSLTSTRRLWVHDDHIALRHLRAAKEAAVVVGPNLFVLPRDIPAGIDLQGYLYLHPSEWPIELWHTAGFTQCPMKSWAVGIDTDAFAPPANPARNGVVVYHKERPEAQLEEIVRSLSEVGREVSVLRYGDYTEDDLIRAGSTAEVVVWHGMHESQGIALQEMLSLDVPIVVADVRRLSDAVGPYVFGAEYDGVSVTAVPYWDDRCGVIVSDYRLVAEAVEYVLAHRSEFAPREFVRERLSLEGQARAFVELWDHFGLSYEDGLRERPSNARPWREPAADRAARFTGRVRRAVARRLGGS